MHFAVNEMARLIELERNGADAGRLESSVDPPCKTCFLEWVNMMMKNFGNFASFDERLV